MESIILIVHMLLALGLIGMVLLQQGKGASAGASFGAGASATVFGSEGSGSFLTRTTAILATLFFITSIALAVIAKDNARLEGDIGMPNQELIDAQTEMLIKQADNEAKLAPSDSDMPAVGE